MRVSVRWLQELVGTEVPGAEIARRLAAAGFPTEEIVRIGEPLEKTIVAEVVSVQERSLTLFDGKEIAEVDARTSQFAADSKVVYRPDSKSLVTEQEIGIEDSPAFVHLPADCETGSPALTRLDDEILVLELPPNRGDLTGIVGIARELACCLEADFTLPAVKLQEAAEPIGAHFSLDVQDQSDTPDYIARLVRNVRVAASPFWLKWRLLGCGVRPINNVVDITNYILFKYGQPLHGFDFRLLGGSRIVTRRAVLDEKLTTIDGIARDLTPDVLVIADAQRPVAIAGIMGGLESEIADTTRDVLIECARFNPVVIRRGSRVIGLATEASQRFEVGLDAGMMETASREASALMQSLAGGEPQAGAVAVRSPISTRRFTLSWPRTNRLLGLDLPATKMAAILTRLGFTVTPETEDAQIEVPSFRPDIETTADLAEEIGRIAGYDAIPSQPAYYTAQPGRRHEQSSRARRVRELMAGLGFDEAQTLSFVSETQTRALGAGDPVLLLKPLNERFAALRPSLLLSLLDVVSLNLRRGNRDLRLFEIGSSYADPVSPHETIRFAGILTGAREPLAWDRKPQSVDFYDASGTVVSLLTSLGVAGVEVRPAPSPGFDPGAAAEIALGDGRLGILGLLDRALTGVFDIAEPVFGWELDWNRIWEAAPGQPAFQSLPRLPAVERDYALVTDATVSATRLLREVRRFGGDLIAKAEVFDYYAGKSLPAGKRSIGIRLTLRTRDRTLTSAEVDEFSGRLTATLKELLGAELRQ